MGRGQRVFILGAGFSKPAKMPLATELLPLLAEQLQDNELHDWLGSLRERIDWLSQSDEHSNPIALNIEEVFHYAYFDIEAHRLKQQLVPVGRQDGPGTPANTAQSIEAWLSHLEESLHDVILEKEDEADLAPIQRWAERIEVCDSVLTFNYDTLVERALAASSHSWHHGTDREGAVGVGVFKLHGSIDWIVAHRSESFCKRDLLFDKENANRSDQDTGDVEDDYRLWRFRTREQLRKWIEGRDLQSVPEGASPMEVGITGLGAYKQLHKVPGLGRVWARGMQTLYEADLAVVIGFSMSEFDAMAQMQFAEVARKRREEGRPLSVIVVNPAVDESMKNRFRRVFRFVDFVEKRHEQVDWRRI